MRKIFLIILLLSFLHDICCSVAAIVENEEDTSTVSIEELKNRVLAILRRMNRQNERSLLWIMYFEAKERRVARYRELCEKLEKVLNRHFPYAVGGLREKAFFALESHDQLKKDKEYNETYYWYFDKSTANLVAVGSALSLIVGYLGAMMERGNAGLFYRGMLEEHYQRMNNNVLNNPDINEILNE